MSKFGLSDDICDKIVDLFKSFPEIEKVIIFGSRAMGNYKKSSDVDFAVVGKDVDFRFIQHLSAKLDELPTPYMFDVLSYNIEAVGHLKTDIDNYGKIFYEKSNS